jgi:hypothetical protein
MATLSSPTLNRLLRNIRSLLNQPDRNNSFWSDEDLTEYINEAIRVYFVEVHHANEGLFTTTTDLNIVADTETIALPSDCFEIKAVYKKVSNGYVPLGYDNSASGYSTQGGSGAEAYFPKYSLRGNNLVLRPTPNFSETAGIKLEYIQFPETVVNGGDAMTAQVSPIFKPLIEMYAVYKAKLKESMVNGVVMHKVPEDNLKDLYGMFKEATSRRTASPTFVTPFDPETN